MAKRERRDELQKEIKRLVLIDVVPLEVRFEVATRAVPASKVDEMNPNTGCRRHRSAKEGHPHECSKVKAVNVDVAGGARVSVGTLGDDNEVCVSEDQLARSDDVHMPLPSEPQTKQRQGQTTSNISRAQNETPARPFDFWCNARIASDREPM